ncbi:MAG TPA: hypothetical protein ENO08_07805 [Candidatus Eisenbacteria bacterium]|uniref:Uncharacterized protein n=1 Tax=Eiseniibacteriota bacterium TaxID=2212470 RepID=A0A7V2AW43_UNCEI|nr:hypothetical protein [Candidatus Eisenbacteria bacterium]
MELFRDDVFETVLENMEERFDSHDFIFEMMRRFPREYTKALYECRRSKDPIQTLHQKIGRKLLEFEDRIRKTRRKSSRNVRGLPSDNQYWEKKKTEPE